MIRRCFFRLSIASSLLLVGQLAVGAAETAGPERAEPDPVCLIVDYGDGVQKHFTQLPWKAEMTVLDALLLARDHQRGIRLDYRGRAATSLVTQIDDLANQGGGGRNWIYYVNKKPGSRSCGIQPLQAGDTVLWKFERYR
jgi:hypothetical protein